MAQVTAATRREFGPMVAMVAPATLAAISNDELLDRLHQARSLVQKSQAATRPGDRRQLGEQARAILAARPREQVERLVTDKIAKAAIVPDAHAAEALREQARELLRREPPAVRRSGSKRAPVAKADPGPSGLIAVFDEAGNPIYVIDPDSPDVIPLSNPDPAAFGDEAVAKAMALVRRAARQPGTAKAKDARQAPRPRTGR